MELHQEGERTLGFFIIYSSVVSDSKRKLCGSVRAVLTMPLVVVGNIGLEFKSQKGSQ